MFLDFQPAADWATTRERIRGTVHIDMEKVARGQMAEELAKLDPTATYAGLGYDRRSSYHSLLAGEYLSEKGPAGWASTLSRSYLAESDRRIPTCTTVGANSRPRPAMNLARRASRPFPFWEMA